MSEELTDDQTMRAMSDALLTVGQRYGLLEQGERSPDSFSGESAAPVPTG